MYPAFPLPNPSPMRKKKAPGFVALTALAALTALTAAVAQLTLHP